MRKSFISGVVILAAAGLVARLFGFFSRIYLSNLAGAEGIGLYELVLPVYTAVVLTITSGIIIAVSKMVAEQNARRNRFETGRITMCALALVTAAGALVSLFIFANAGVISKYVLGDARTRNALLVLAVCLPAVVAGAALKGYFYGMQLVMPAAFSQVAEQAVKLSVLIALSKGVAESGAEYACSIATLAALLGEMANLAVLSVVFAIRQKRISRERGVGKPQRKRKIIACLLKSAVPVSANRLVVSTLSAAELILIPVMLAAGGLDGKSSMEMFGRLTGMAMPLIMFPSLVTNSLATSLVPAISESVTLRNRKSVGYQVSKAIQATFILGIFFSSLFLCYPDDIGSLIYRRESIGDLLFMLSFSCAFVYLQQTMAGIMNGLGKQGVLLVNTVIGLSMRIGAIYFLVPVMGVKGYIIGFIISLVVAEILNLSAIHKITGMVFDLRNWLIKPGLVGFVVVITGKCIRWLFDMFHVGAPLATLLSLSASAMTAAFLMVTAGVLKPQEILRTAGLKKG
ncbi:MAG: putative polysaccharide biosynthesis protein [Acetivibrionales bacterium]